MQACPLYLSEMAPAHLRGSLNICFQLATAVGILAANSLNYGERTQNRSRFCNAVWVLTSNYAKASQRCFQRDAIEWHLPEVPQVITQYTNLNHLQDLGRTHLGLA